MALSLDLRFESCVVLDGDKTDVWGRRPVGWFESCVVLDGDKTIRQMRTNHGRFESCVVLDGDKTTMRPDCTPKNV